MLVRLTAIEGRGRNKKVSSLQLPGERFA